MHIERTSSQFISVHSSLNANFETFCKCKMSSTKMGTRPEEVENNSQFGGNLVGGFHSTCGSGFCGKVSSGIGSGSCSKFSSGIGSESSSKLVAASVAVLRRDLTQPKHEHPPSKQQSQQFSYAKMLSG
jgi:hypothetical protein